MIEFTKAASNTPNEQSLMVWAEVMNWHVDKVLIRNIFKEVILYESWAYPTETPECKAFVIWNGKKKSVWLITDTSGRLSMDSEAYKKLKDYSIRQANRLFSMR